MLNIKSQLTTLRFVASLSGPSSLVERKIGEVRGRGQQAGVVRGDECLEEGEHIRFYGAGVRVVFSLSVRQVLAQPVAERTLGLTDVRPRLVEHERSPERFGAVDSSSSAAAAAAFRRVCRVHVGGDEAEPGAGLCFGGAKVQLLLLRVNGDYLVEKNSRRLGGACSQRAPRRTCIESCLQP